MSRINLMGYSIRQMEQLFEQLNERSYHGRQLFKWLYHDRLFDFSRMSDLSKKLRLRLGESYTIQGLQLVRKAKSVDGAEKFLFRLEDGHPIETVLIPETDRTTVCLSSQAGCAYGCKFCATGTMGLIRNLSVGEMIGQLVFLRELYSDDCFTNVVFMGMGEPFGNYDNLMESLRIMTSSLGLGIGARKVVVSTVGIVPQIRKLADSGSKARLAISLHAATQEKRLKVAPVAQKFDLKSLMDATRYYTHKTGFRVMFEYCLFEGFNDTAEDALTLSKLIRGIPCKINLIAYNPVPGFRFRKPSDEKVDWFARQLYPRAPAVMVRKSRGQDISAACGQLAGREK